MRVVKRARRRRTDRELRTIRREEAGVILREEQIK